MTAPERLSAALADRYLVERQLGQGGMATVYLAEDVKHKRKVALKVLRPELAAVLGGERFVQEITTTASLQHPHILPLFDSGTADGFLYYVMPYVEGETLRDRLNRDTQLAIDDAIRITREVADALDYAHRQGVIHRDIKPENILLHDGRPMVADFGIALALSAAAGGRMTETGMSLGTPHYMSPEQATADKDITARSDVYSLASVLYEMLTGEPPHMGNSAQAIIMKIVTEEAAPVTKLRKSVPSNVTAAVGKALEKLPADRFDSARAFADALADPAFMTVGTTRVSTRPRVHASTSVPLLAAVALLTLLAAWGWFRPRPAPSAGLVTRFYHEPDSTHQLSALCCGPLHAVSRDGRRFAYTGQSLGRSRIYVRDLDQLDARPLPGTQGGTSLFFSPDGAWLGFVDQGRTLYKVALSGGAPIPLTTIGDAPWGAAWTDRNTIVFSSGASGDLWSVSADGGTPVRLTTPDTTAGQEGLRTPSVVPGRDAILVTVWMATDRAEDARVGLVRLDEPERVQIVTRGMHPQAAASNHLAVALPGGNIAVQPFDLRSGTVSGAQTYVADEVFVSVSGGWSDFALSWSGMLLYRRGGFDPRMAWVRPDGAARDLPMDLDDVRHFDAPRFAPDGRRLALSASMVGGHRVLVMDLDRGSLLRVTLDGDSEHSDWTDDGDSIVVSRGYRELVMYPADRSGEGRVVLSREDLARQFPDEAVELGRVSVSGPWIAFGRFVRIPGGTRSDIAVTRRDWDSVTTYVGTPFQESAPAIAPDGRWLAYVSNETGRDEIYVSAFPTAASRATVSLDGGTEPVWAPDGRTLYFRNELGGLVAARVRSDQGRFVVTSLEALPIEQYELSPGGADYDVAPGGDGFAMIETRSSGSHLVLVLNALSMVDRDPAGRVRQ